ncbi:MAG: hypothetical protein ACRETZ_08650 [Steroidobacteraceae bacterium]
MHGEAPAPDSTAVRVALWRALHVQVDPPPHVFTDEVDRDFAGRRDGLRPPSGGEEILVAGL